MGGANLIPDEVERPSSEFGQKSWDSALHGQDGDVAAEEEQNQDTLASDAAAL